VKFGWARPVLGELFGVVLDLIFKEHVIDS
jgi:hypothetical protein